MTDLVREASANLKGMRFMSRENEKETKTKLEENTLLVRWDLPSVSETSSIFEPNLRKPKKILFRTALTFTKDSDACAELRYLLKKHKSKKTKNPRLLSKDFGRFKASKYSQKLDSEDEDEKEDSSLDDLEVAKHFEKMKRRRKHD